MTTAIECIELVKKYLADKNSVSLEELEANKVAAQAAANAASYAHAHAAKYAEYAADKAAADWVGIYEELTK